MTQPTEEEMLATAKEVFRHTLVTIRDLFSRAIEIHEEDTARGLAWALQGYILVDSTWEDMGEIANYQVDLLGKSDEEMLKIQEEEGALLDESFGEYSDKMESMVRAALQRGPAA